MGINITQTLNHFEFENRENLQNSARNLLQKQNASEKSIQNIMDKTIFNSSESRVYSSSQLSILRASSQISMSGKLKETLKYLKDHSVSSKKEKKPVLGELWNSFFEEEQDYSELDTSIVVDYSLKNIFEAA